MNVASIGKGLTGQVSKIGQKLADGKMAKVSKFFEADGFNIAPAAFNTLIMTAVIVPRLIQARDADERREILTRDSITILTLLFALKSAKAGLSKIASKSSGLVLTNKDIAKGNIFKKAMDFLKPSGISSLTSEQVTSKYGQIANKDGLVKLVNYLGENGGNPSKVLNMKELADATSKALGNVKGKAASEITEIIKGKTDKELEPLTKLLSGVNNPLTKIGKHVNAWLEAGSLATIVSFLGFGLPAINKKITAKNHAKNKALGRPPLPQPLFRNGFNKVQQETFKQFLG